MLLANRTPLSLATWLIAAAALVFAWIAFSAGTSPCAQAAASCAFDDDSIVAGDFTLMSDTAFGVTVGHSATADAVLTIPDTLGVADTFVMTAQTQVLTNKSLTAPTITGAPTAAGATWADLGGVTTADINGGTIDGVTIGGSVAAAGTFAALVGTSGDFGDGAITNVGGISLDSISADATTIDISAPLGGDLTFNDSIKASFGTDGDADIYYNNTDLIINPRVSGGGQLMIGTGTTPQYAHTILELSAGTATAISFGPTTASEPFILTVVGSSGNDVSNGTGLWGEYFRGWHTGAYYNAAGVSVEVDGTPGVGDMPGRIIFKTSPDGAASPTERLRINQAGDFDFNNGNLNNLGGSGTDITSTQANFAQPLTFTAQADTLGVADTNITSAGNVLVVTGDGGGNTVATISGGLDGEVLVLIFVDALVTITDDNSHGGATVDLSAAFTSADDTVLQLIQVAGSWYEIARSVN